MSLNSPPRIIRQAQPKDSPVGVDERRGTAHADRPFARRLFERQRLPTWGELVHKPVPKPATRKRKRGNNNNVSKKSRKKVVAEKKEPDAVVEAVNGAVERGVRRNCLLFLRCRPSWARRIFNSRQTVP